MRTKQHIQPMHDTSSRFKTKLEPLIWTLVFIIMPKKQYWYWCYISIIIKKSFSQVICWHLASFLKWGSLNLGSRPWRTKASVQPHFESEAVWIQDRGHCGRKQAFNHCVITNAKLKKCALHFVIERWFFSLFDDANFAVGSRLWILWLISTCHSVNWKLLILVYIK